MGGTDADTASKLNRRPPATLPPPPLPRTGSRAKVAEAALLPLPGVVALAAPVATMGVVL